MKTQSDRTLFFDLLPLDLGEIMGFKTRFLLYTVPGQVFYNATRKLVLKGADALVFVADSEVGKMEENKESLANLRTNLAEYGLTLDAIPWVIQYNKRDLPNVYTVDELNAELNPGNVPSFEAVASEGKGVFETFRGVSHLLMEKVTRDLRRMPAGGTRTGSPSSEEPAPVAPAASRAPEPAPAPRMVPQQAPVQAMRREAQGSPTDANPMRIDYGTELELPGSSDPGARESTVTNASTSEAVRTLPLPRPSSALKRPGNPAPAAAPRGGVDTAEATEAGGSATGASVVREIVVPVKLPPNARYEIVIRLQLDTTS
jgi:signal recognition particle receptor subunit beta